MAICNRRQVCGLRSAKINRPSESEHSHVRHFKWQAHMTCCLLSKRFNMAANGQSRRHDHETTVDHSLMRGSEPQDLIRRGAASV